MKSLCNLKNAADQGITFPKENIKKHFLNHTNFSLEFLQRDRNECLITTIIRSLMNAWEIK